MVLIKVHHPSVFPLEGAHSQRKPYLSIQRTSNPDYFTMEKSADENSVRIDNEMHGVGNRQVDLMAKARSMASFDPRIIAAFIHGG